MISREKRIEMYKNMLRIRKFEEALIDLNQKGVFLGYVHLYIGQEAIAVGACSNLNNNDYISSTHRGHGHCIAKGADMGKMMAEIFGKKNGYCHGKGGSMHISDVDMGIVGAEGISAAGVPLGTGAALTSQLNKKGQMAIAFVGDGASNCGVFYESLNLAAVWKLPIIYIIENNGYGLGTPIEIVSNIKNLSDKAKAFNIPGVSIDGNDVELVYETVFRAAERAREGKGPTLIECKTFRWRGHHEGENREYYLQYTTEDKINYWMKKCPIKNYKEKLLSMGIDNNIFKNIEKEINTEIKKAIDYAEKSPFPELEDIYTDHYCVSVDKSINNQEPKNKGIRILDYKEAIAEALYQEMKRDERVIILGLECGWRGGTFFCGKGLQEEFGKDRVRETPISESAFTGAGIGAGITGMRPVVEIYFQDFITRSWDEIVNTAAKSIYMSGGNKRLPMVIRAPGGSRYPLKNRSEGPQHSQHFESMFMHLPGLKVTCAATPYDVKGLLATAIRDDNPVLFCEDKLLYYGKDLKNLYPTLLEPVPENDYTIPFGCARVHRKGSDVTIVAIFSMLHKALRAAEDLAKEGINVEVIDPRTLVPLDEETIIKSVQKTGRLIIAVEATRRCSIASELAAIIVEKAFKYLKAPIKRVAVDDILIPFSPPLLEEALPGEKEIINAVKKLF